MNFERVDELIEFLREHPERHDQEIWWDDAGIWDKLDPKKLVDDWRCHTTACLAGWAAIRAGWSPVHSDVMVFEPAEGQQLVNPLTPKQLVDMAPWYTEKGAELSVEEIATIILELSNADATYLFHRVQDLDDIELYVNARREDASPLEAYAQVLARWNDESDDDDE